jgi:hypothetical protein
MTIKIIFSILLASSFLAIYYQNKTIQTLENENKNLFKVNENLKIMDYTEYNRIYNNAKKAIADSIIFDKKDNEVMLCGMSKLDVFNFHKTGKVNTKYQSNYILFDIYNSRDYDVEYTTPTKNKVEYSSETNFINPPTENLIFIPKDTGFYYWTGNLIVRNQRTGRIQRWPFKDSLLVY